MWIRCVTTRGICAGRNRRNCHWRLCIHCRALNLPIRESKVHATTRPRKLTFVSVRVNVTNRHIKIRTYWKCCWFLLGTKEAWVIAPTASLHLLTFQNMEQNVSPEIDLYINIIFCTGVASGIQNLHIRARNGSTICLRISRALLTTSVLLWPLVAWNVNPVRHYSRHLRWWKPAQLSLTSLHPLQGSQPTNKRVGYIMQPPGHENWRLFWFRLKSLPELHTWRTTRVK